MQSHVVMWCKKMMMTVALVRGEFTFFCLLLFCFENDLDVQHNVMQKRIYMYAVLMVDVYVLFLCRCIYLHSDASKNEKIYI